MFNTDFDKQYVKVLLLQLRHSDITFERALKELTKEKIRFYVRNHPERGFNVVLNDDIKNRLIMVREIFMTTPTKALIFAIERILE